MTAPMPHIHEAVISLGANCGDRESNIKQAIRCIGSRLGEAFSGSEIYETPDAYGGERPYLNSVVKVFSIRSRAEIEDFCKNVEKEMGRDAEARARGDVPVDLDLVVFDGQVLKERDFNASFFQIGYANLT